jgi:hypothetical protein
MGRRSRTSTLPSWEMFIGFVTGDDLSLILRCHLGLEAMLNKVIEDRAHAAEGNELDRLPFMAKVDVCIALGAIPPVKRPAWAIANKIRNEFAHNLEAELTAAQAADLRSALGWPWTDGSEAQAQTEAQPAWPAEQMVVARNLLRDTPQTPRHRIALYLGLLYLECFVATRLPRAVLDPRLPG